MRKIAACFLICLLSGCSMGEHLVRDPHFTKYQENLGQLEHSYYQKELTYSQYLDKKKMLDDHYAKEVQAREETIRGDLTPGAAPR